VREILQNKAFNNKFKSELNDKDYKI